MASSTQKPVQITPQTEFTYDPNCNGRLTWKHQSLFEPMVYQAGISSFPRFITTILKRRFPNGNQKIPRRCLFLNFLCLFWPRFLIDWGCTLFLLYLSSCWTLKLLLPKEMKPFPSRKELLKTLSTALLNSTCFLPKLQHKCSSVFSFTTTLLMSPRIITFAGARCLMISKLPGNSMIPIRATKETPKPFVFGKMSIFPNSPRFFWTMEKSLSVVLITSPNRERNNQEAHQTSFKLFIWRGTIRCWRGSFWTWHSRFYRHKR